MNKKWQAGLTCALLLAAGGVRAMECDVDFRAKRMVEEKRWFGAVERPEFRSGTVSGEGSDEKDCMRDALADIRADGWDITWQRLTRVRDRGGRNADDSRERPGRNDRERDRLRR